MEEKRSLGVKHPVGSYKEKRQVLGPAGGRPAHLFIEGSLAVRRGSQAPAQWVILLARCVEKLIWVRKRLGSSRNVLGPTQRKMQ